MHGGLQRNLPGYETVRTTAVVHLQLEASMLPPVENRYQEKAS